MSVDQIISEYDERGHVTCAPFFKSALIDKLTDTCSTWAQHVISELNDEERRWYCETDSEGTQQLRKLDNPVYHKAPFQNLARNPELVALVERMIGPGLSVPFSQIFFKPPRGGGPKPAHQDNFYFGCSNRDGMVTAWIALDAATTENGCLYFGDGTNKSDVIPHIAPEGEPYNLQIPTNLLEKIPMSPAPVARGGVSFHHGNTVHQSSDNRSPNWRRAVAIHYVNRDTEFANPALDYDASKRVGIS